MKLVYKFNEGNKDMRDLLGGKGANLAEMTSLDLPVPEGFVITTDASKVYLNNESEMPTHLIEQIRDYSQWLEDATGKDFGGEDNLLLVAVRSGAAVSMPGMMDTILNIGLNKDNVKAFAEFTDDSRFAYDCYRRLLQMFGEVVYDIPMDNFSNILDEYKDVHDIDSDADIPVDGLQAIAEQFEQVYVAHGKEFPYDPRVQIIEAIEAVFESWNNERAVVYRRLEGYPDDLGTAAVVQSMVFGNSGNESGTGVAFTRDPSTGEANLYGEYLLNAQGEDVVAGIRTPENISRLEEQFPEIYEQFMTISNQLENHYKDMQDIEFTIEEGVLYILQTRTGKRAARASVKIAIDLVKEGVITKEEAIAAIDPVEMDQLLLPTFDEAELQTATVISSVGLPASPGAATGIIAFSPEQAMKFKEAGHSVILTRPETSPEDIEGMIASEAIVTTHGGMTSHAAVVARGMGKCCVTAASDLQMDLTNKVITVGDYRLHEGDTISVNGSTGEIYLGEVKTQEAQLDDDFQTMMTWAQEISRMDVRINAETPAEISQGLEFGAKGIGLARTEHMFFDGDRLVEMRRFILAKSDEERTEILQRISAMQQADFRKLFELLDGYPIIVRLLDPPLHEFLPYDEREMQEVADTLEVPFEELRTRIAELQEMNPMLGHRGCRLAVTYPELYKMQVEAMVRSLLELKEAGINPQLEIMIPLIVATPEYVQLQEDVKERIVEVFAEQDTSIPYDIGLMVETPRACIVSGQLAAEADFISYGTNDLTQLTFGFSRDDAGKFIGDYLAQDLLEADPFQTIDVEGVGYLVDLSAKQAKEAKDSIKLGVCGELGGDPQSIHFFDRVGLDYVSCSPFRVPGAWIASAQATI